ncbi:RNA-directed DNA polymerase, eukaryota [Tanacetum coccineum]
MSWCREEKNKSLFKVDFEKTYDSVRWDFLDDILSKFGFKEKWRKWIHCCLHSLKGSIIINGSPNEEFQFGKGLKQGDPLSPFLFLLVMETLHISFQRVVDAGMYQGIKVGGLINLSHMFYADDAVFVGEWSESNISSLIHVLDCFHKVSGLKINMSKSKLMGIEVEAGKVSRAAVKLGCLVLKAPFLYLGSYVGGDMHRLQSWEDIVDRVRRRLSKWKMKMLSIGGRLTLIKSVLGSMPIFHMSMFKVPTGILRILESIRGKFFNGHETYCKKASWVQWNKRGLFSEDDGNIDGVSRKGVNTRKWEMVFRLYSGKMVGAKGANLRKDFLELMLLENLKRITVGSKLTQPCLTHSFRRIPRGCLEESQVEELSKVVQTVELNNSQDKWSWSLNTVGEYTVASARYLIDVRLLPKGELKTRWIRYVSIKVNTFAWKVMTNSFPTRFNISRRGMDIESLACVNCDVGIESTNHLFFACDMAKKISKLIARWWDVPFMDFDSYGERRSWIDNVKMPKKNKNMFKGIFFVMWWLLWNFRNKKMFEDKSYSKASFFDESAGVVEVTNVTSGTEAKMMEQCLRQRWSNTCTGGGVVSAQEMEQCLHRI